MSVPLISHDPEVIQTFSNVESLIYRTWDYQKPDEPVLGQTDDVIVAKNVPTLLESSRGISPTVLETLEGSNSFIGFSLAMPIGVMDPTRAPESRDTAYLYWTALEERFRNLGLVSLLQAKLHPELSRRGYSFMEEHLMIDNGYADTVVEAYSDAIVARKDGVWWDEVGPQRWVRIDLHRLAPGL